VFPLQSLRSDGSNIRRHNIYCIIFGDILSRVRLSQLGTAATTDLLYEPQMVDEMME
jgi:hypothetical protein